MENFPASKVTSETRSAVIDGSAAIRSDIASGLRMDDDGGGGREGSEELGVDGTDEALAALRRRFGGVFGVFPRDGESER